MKKKLMVLLILVLSDVISLGRVLTAFAQDSVGITYSKEYTTDGQVKIFETPDKLVFQGIIAEFPDQNFTITVDPDKGANDSNLNYVIESVWIGKSTDGFVDPISRNHLDTDDSLPEVKTVDDHTYSLEGLNIENNEQYGLFINTSLTDSSERTVGYNTFAAFFKISAPVENQSGTDKTITDNDHRHAAYYWQNNETGWWVQSSDGTYLTNQWYCSPDSNLWYYMGSDGYMLTNTITPDGYRVDSDGVWVQ